MVYERRHAFTPRWREALKNRINNVAGEKRVKYIDDLPDPVNGTHELQDNTIYRLVGQIESDKPITVGNMTPIIGHHREHCWFIYTGSGTAIQSQDNDILMRNIGLNAPGATLFDIDGTNTDELIMDSVYFADDQEKGHISDLGTIGTFRGPELRVAGIRDFDAGLTFDGEYNRLYIECKTRDITASNVTIFEFTENFSTASVDMANSDVADVQSDTVVIDVDASATIDNVFMYRGNSHDSTVTKSNILTGAADPTVEPYWVKSSYPLRESSVVGELSSDSETETTLSTQNEWVEVSGVTSEGNEAQRTEGDGEGGVNYIGTKDTNAHVTIPVSWYGANGDIYEFGIGKNGTVQPTSAMRVEGGGQNANRFVAPSGIEDLTNGDTVSLMVRNTSATNNVTVTAYNINFLGS